MEYVELTVHTTSEASELVADVMWQYTEGGVAVSDAKDVVALISGGTGVYWDYIDEALQTPRSDVLVKCFLKPDIADAAIGDIRRSLEEMRSRGGLDFGTLEATRRTIEGDDWIDVWKKHFRPLHIGKNVVIVPAWLIFENTQEVIIDRQTFDSVQKIRQCKRRPSRMGEMSSLSGMVYCADCGKRMYLCRCTTMKQAEYFNCSTYRKKKKNLCTSHQITVKAVETLLLDDLKRTLRFAQSQKEEFLRMLEENSEVKTKQEIKENLRELSAAEERIKALDKIIQSLYEDKVAGILSEERYLKLSDTYETEQADLTEKAQMLKAEIEKDKKEKDEILDFLCLVEKYSSIEELTPEIIRSFVDRIIVHEKRKENGHYRQEIEIVYNFIGAVEFPDFLDDDEYDGLSC